MVVEKRRREFEDRLLTVTFLIAWSIKMAKKKKTKKKATKKKKARKKK